MATCNTCGRVLRKFVLTEQFLAEAQLVGLVELLRVEVEYLRQRCEEEDVVVSPRAAFVARQGSVPAYADADSFHPGATNG